MNILFFLTPKAMCAHVYTDNSMRQAMEKLEVTGYEALPILNRDGTYCGTLTSGDLLWGVKHLCNLSMEQAEEHGIMEIPLKRKYKEVSITMEMRDLVRTATQQNFVPVVDDKHTFIGIVTRQAIIQYCLDAYLTETAT